VGGTDSALIHRNTEIGRLTVGQDGDGELRIRDGGVVMNYDASIGARGFGSGSATVHGMDARWYNSGTLSVGFLSDGGLNIAGGGYVESSDGVIGDSSRADGAVTVGGAGSIWNSGDLTVGEGGVGTLTILNGGSVSSADAIVGKETSSDGRVSVSGSLGTVTTWTISGDLTVSEFGSGTLGVENGANVSTVNGYIGKESGSTGAVTVGFSGDWNNSGDLTVGDGGTGSLTINLGGSVINLDGYIGKDSGSNGIVTVDGTGSTWTNCGDLYHAVDGSGTLEILNDAIVYVVDDHIQGDGSILTTSSGSQLIVGGAKPAAATASAVAAAADGGSGDSAEGVISTHPGGAIHFSGGRMITDVLDLSGGGEFNWTGGRLDVTRVEGSLENQGGVLYPRSLSAGILVMGDYSQGPAASVVLRIPLPGAASFDKLHVAGDAVFEGQVLMRFINGFAPRMGDQFPLVMVDGLLADDAASYGVQNLAPGFRFDIVRDGGVVTMVALTDGVFVPEPSAFLLLLTSMSTAASSRFGRLGRRQLRKTVNRC
jgi:T5SS/PEP-CTERM-associated repeat protein